jgi:hypothetical protein
MITTFEKAIQKSTTRARLSVHHTSFLWAFCQEEFVRSTIHRPVVFRGAGLPFSEISASKTRRPLGQVYGGGGSLVGGPPPFGEAGPGTVARWAPMNVWCERGHGTLLRREA